MAGGECVEKVQENSEVAGASSSPVAEDEVSPALKKIPLNALISFSAYLAIKLETGINLPPLKPKTTSLCSFLGIIDSRKQS